MYMVHPLTVNYQTKRYWLILVARHAEMAVIVLITLLP